MRSTRSTILSWLALPPLALCVSCYEPAVRERVVLAIQDDGQARLSVETVFKQGTDLSREEREEILRVMDQYESGHDAWLRGFEKAEARDVAHRCQGANGHPEKILREATLPTVESLVKAMPDAIANIRLRSDPERGTVTLSIVHIDVPAPIRENRRRMEKEFAAWSRSMFTLASRQCDVYDYLADHADRRRALLGALKDPSTIDEMIDPRETALVERFIASIEAMGVFSASPEPGAETPVLASVSFSAFEADFCVKPPEDAVDVVATDGLEPQADAESGRMWCFPRLATDELVDRMEPESDPPLSTFDEDVSEEPDLAAAAFTCRRYDDERAVESKVWELILPRPYYDLTWSEGPRQSATQQASP